MRRKRALLFDVKAIMRGKLLPELLAYSVKSRPAIRKFFDTVSFWPLRTPFTTLLRLHHVPWLFNPLHFSFHYSRSFHVPTLYFDQRLLNTNCCRFSERVKGWSVSSQMKQVRRSARGYFTSFEPLLITCIFSPPATRGCTWAQRSANTASDGR